MKYSQKRICSQEHAIIQTDYRVIQTKMATAIFLCTTLLTKWNRTVRYNGCRAKMNRAFSATAFEGMHCSLSLSASSCHYSG